MSDRYDLVPEIPVFRRALDVVVAAQGDRVHLLPADVQVLGHEFRRGAHDVGLALEQAERRLGRIDGTVLGMRDQMGAAVEPAHDVVHELLVLQPAAPASVENGIGGAGHVLDTPG